MSVGVVKPKERRYGFLHPKENKGFEPLYGQCPYTG